MLAIEGGYTNDKNDKGGETTWGVTKGRQEKTGYNGSMKNLTQGCQKMLKKIII